jgi:hypothetical protein
VNGASSGSASGPSPEPSPPRRAVAWTGLAAALCAAAILFSGLSRGIPRVYDLPDHLGYAYQALQAFERGDFYPRWLASLNDGFGEATFVFYPPVLHFTAAALAAIFGGDVLTGLYLTLLLFAVVGGLGVFRFVSRVAGPAAGVLACLIFALTPYRVFEMYDSGLYSAFAAGCLAPWALLALARIAELGDAAPPSESLRRIGAWAIAFAGIVLTNMPSAVLWTYLTAIWMVVEVAATRRWKIALRVVAGGAWGILIAGVYLLPAVIEMRAVSVPLETSYRSNFLFQASGTWMTRGLKSVFDRMGLIPATALVLSLAISAAALSWGKFRDARSRVFLRVTATVGLAAFFLATPASRWAWQMLPQLSRVNFPWRLLEPLGLATASASGAALWILVCSRGQARLMRVLSLFFFFCLFTLWGFFDVAVSDANGHMPPQAARAAIPNYARKEVFFLLKGARRAAEMAAEPPIVCDPSCRAQILDWSPTRREILVASPQPTRIALRTYYFPGWRASRGGEAPASLSVRAEPGTGRIQFDLPPGENRVVARFGTTPPRVVGGIVSLLAVGAWLAAMAVTRRSALYQI